MPGRAAAPGRGELRLAARRLSGWRWSSRSSLHILGAILFAGGATVAALAYEAGRRRGAPGEVALLLGLARLGAVLVGLGGLLVLAFGLWLVDLSGYGYGAAWIRWALGLFALSVALGAAGGRRPKRARLLAAWLARDGAGGSEELRRLLDDPLSRAANYAAGALVLVILALMVWKPT